MGDTILGRQLLDLISSANDTVVLVAPFIKADSLRQVLEAISKPGVRVDCVTRWHPEDIVDCVCDIEIFDLLSEHANTHLWRHPYLHAKYFRGDQTCLVGSANLTGRALGWRLPSNLELLVELDARLPLLQNWETSLMANSVRVTSELRDQIAKEADQLAAQRPQRVSLDVEGDDDPNPQWMPLCPSPEKLFRIYTGELNKGRMVSSAFELAQRDLKILGPPMGYSEAQFVRHVADRIQKLDVIQKIVSASSIGLPDAQAVDLVAEYMDTSFTIDRGDAWKTIKRWMMHFFPEDYRIEVGQEVLVKGRTIDRE